MNIISMLTKKRNKGRFTKEEIDYFIKEYCRENIPDDQASALVMAMCINVLNSEEIKELTIAMAESGEKIDMSDIDENFIEKQSIGGVGDKVTLILLPILAALDIPAGKLSNRGIGIGGSTADKFMSIPGFRADIPIDEYKDNLKEEKIGITTNFVDVATAEKKLYDIRRKIDCMDNLELVAASIMSRKIASGAKKLLINVQCGHGSTIKDYKKGKEFSKILIDSGKLAGIEIRCVISKIYEPLGKNIGNTLEVIEAIEALNGNIEKDVKQVVMEVATQIILMSGKAKKESEAKAMIEEVIKTGKALEKFKTLVKMQNGDISYIEDTEKFEKAKYKMEIKSNKTGYIQMIDSERLGNIAIYLGAGRKLYNDEIDNAAGITLVKKMDDKVKNGETIAYIYTNDESKLKGASNNFLEAYTIGKKMFNKGSAVLGVMTK